MSDTRYEGTEEKALIQLATMFQKQAKLYEAAFNEVCDKHGVRAEDRVKLLNDAQATTR